MMDYVTPEASRNAATGKSNAVDRWLLAQLHQFVGEPRLSLELWDGYSIGEQHQVTAVKFLDRSALQRLFFKPTYTFGNLYAQGRIVVRGPLIATLETIYKGLEKRTHDLGRTAQWLRKRLAFRPRPNSVQRARDNIQTHYDLGEDFYQLWLDRHYMQYTCGYFPDPDFSLEQAQIAKLEYICRKLALKPGETVVEAGSGWGGLSRYMARYYGVKVRAYNISPSQIEYARRQAQIENLADAIEYVEDDCRNIRGSYDVFVSVGMLEHLGPDNYPALGQAIDQCLKDDGRGFVHTIGQMSPRRINEWIERRIFPGAQPPSLAQMMAIFEPHDMVVADVENLRAHYAQTLEHWLARFAANEEQVTRMFDTEFVRAWQLYLAGSAAAFTTGGLQLYQVLFRRKSCTKLPITRDHLYRPGLLHALPDQAS